MKTLFTLLLLCCTASAQFVTATQASSIGQTTATITWQTCAVSDSTVKYGTTTAYGQQVADGVLVSSHSLVLSGLNVGTLYHASVVSKDGNSQAVSSPDFTFTTAVAPPPPPGTNVAPQGIAYRWHTNTTALLNTNKVVAAGLNDNDLTTDVHLNGGNNETSAVYEAGGVVWSTAQSISSVKFISGTWVSSGDGGFSANLSLQFTTDGTTWTQSGWTVSPAYAYDSAAASGVIYTFSGTAVFVRGVRVSGQVRTSTNTSYWENMREVQAFTPGAPPPTHSVALNWNASTSTNVVGYNLYRSQISGSGYGLVFGAISGTSITDTTVQNIQTYYYVVTAVDSNGAESVYSNQVQAVIP